MTSKRQLSEFAAPAPETTNPQADETVLCPLEKAPSDPRALRELNFTEMALLMGMALIQVSHCMER